MPNLLWGGTAAVPAEMSAARAGCGDTVRWSCAVHSGAGDN